MRILLLLGAVIFFACASPCDLFAAVLSRASDTSVSAKEISDLTEIAVHYTSSIQRLPTASAKETNRLHAQNILSMQLDTSEFVADGTMTQSEADASIHELKKMSDQEWRKTFLAGVSDAGILQLNLTELKEKLLSNSANWQRISPTKIQVAFDKSLPQPYNLITLTFRLVKGKWVAL